MLRRQYLLAGIASALDMMKLQAPQPPPKELEDQPTARTESERVSEKST